MKSNREKEIQEISTRFLPEFANETDRGCVLMVAAMADKMLEDILSEKMVKTSKKKDLLFAPHGPLNTFNEKIDFAYRLGLISEKLCRNLHMLRDIRNRFAHHIFDCNFNDGAVKNQLSELIKSIEKFFSFMKAVASEVAKDNKKWAAIFKEREEKADFLVCAIALYLALNTCLLDIGQPIKPTEDENIFL